MASRGLAVLKFVGTVSLGLLTGLSFSLSTVTVPTLLTLPSARSAAKAFRNLSDAAADPLHKLSGIAGGAFLLAFVLSPRAVRHPYLLYTSLLVLGSRLATSDVLAPYLFSTSPAAASSSTSDPFAPASPPSSSPRRSTTAAHMEASYEVLGPATAGTGSVWGGSVSDSHSDGGANPDDAAAAAAAGPAVNGEEVRAAVEVFLKRQIARTVVTGLAFAMAIVGLWGDGAAAAAAAY